MVADPTVASLLTVIGLGPVVAGLLQAIFAALNVTDAQRDRFGPLAAIVVGTAMGIAASFVLGLATPATIYTAFLIGIGVSGTSTLTHDTLKSLGAPV